MRKLVAIVALVAVLVALAPVSVHAHGAVAAALAFGAFATFGLLATAPFWAYPAYAYPAPVSAPPAYYAPAPAYAPPPAPAIQREVVYPHGRHMLYGDGVTTAYQWVWVPNAPPPGAPLAPLPGR